ncbi:helix-turn-helix domain-containing protein [Arthrobacter sp. I2-34]|uniref:Helix-turn-helix domain-containing protein n=1 Tax=Arthrobacter hankyongi TaxID=2904801 RepID=A0ABS9L2K1_9MICC|nr:helix-turn-helix transcriptional regulator [Arthrobacter hankyongi]MCG2620874.1 helix-turn-helix domain-containing protein [Arthrobacter hankyongi]
MEPAGPGDLRRLGARLEAETIAQVALGRELAAVRIAARLTRSELAARADIQQAEISRIGRGLGSPTRDTLLRLTEALAARLIIAPFSGPAAG